MSPNRKNTATADLLDPLKDLLEQVLGRLETLETHAGITAPAVTTSSSSRDVVSTASSTSPTTAGLSSSSSHSKGTAIPPAVKAYDEHVKKVVVPFSVACDDLGGLDHIGQHVKEAWEGLRAVVVVAAKAKMPDDPTTMVQQLQPLLAPTQSAVQKIRNLRLDRSWDTHHKAVLEMLSCCSWIVMKPPSGPLPGNFVRDAMSAAEFYSNRIRKDHKGKDDKHIAFCDTLKAMLVDLMEYVNEYHKFGLSWNAKSGVSLAEAMVVMTDDSFLPDDSERDRGIGGGAAAGGSNAASTLVSPKRRRPTAVGSGLGSSSLVAELEQRRSKEGDSAATGLKHVSKDKQTWRKEYKKPEETALPLAPELDAKKKEVTIKKKKPTGLPICEYQERGHKWVLENQTKDVVLREHASGILVVEVTDPKEQVYMFHCNNVTVQVKGGKFKSMIVDSCDNCNVIFDSVISSCELVNCKKIQVQTTGICPVFGIDKTVGCTLYLSEATLGITQFTTSHSGEMNVSYPDGTGDQKEVPIPEQFVHKLVNGAIVSEVSELYH